MLPKPLRGARYGVAMIISDGISRWRERRYDNRWPLPVGSDDSALYVLAVNLSGAVAVIL